MKPLTIETSANSRVHLTRIGNELRIDLEERNLVNSRHIYDTLTWEQAKQLHLWLVAFLSWDKARP